MYHTLYIGNDIITAEPAHIFKEKAIKDGGYDGGYQNGFDAGLADGEEW